MFIYTSMFVTFAASTPNFPRSPTYTEAKLCLFAWICSLLPAVLLCSYFNIFQMKVTRIVCTTVPHTTTMKILSYAEVQTKICLCGLFLVFLFCYFSFGCSVDCNRLAQFKDTRVLPPNASLPKNYTANEVLAYTHLLSTTVRSQETNQRAKSANLSNVGTLARRWRYFHPSFLAARSAVNAIFAGWLWQPPLPLRHCRQFAKVKVL